MDLKIGDHVKSTGIYIPGTSRKDYPIGVIVGVYPEDNEICVRWESGRYQGVITGENLQDPPFNPKFPTDYPVTFEQKKAVTKRLNKLK